MPDSHFVQHALSIAQPLQLIRVTLGIIFVNQTSFLNIFWIFWFGGGLIMPGGLSKSTRSLKCTSSATQADPCDNRRCATPPIHQLRIVRKHPVDYTNHQKIGVGWESNPGFGLIICCETRSLTTSLKGTKVSVDVPDSHFVQHALSIAQPLQLNRVTFGTIFVNQTSFLNIFWIFWFWWWFDHARRSI